VDRSRNFILALAALILIPAAASAQPDGGIPDSGPPLDVNTVPGQPLEPRVIPLGQAPGTRTISAGNYQIWVRGPLGERLVAEVAMARRSDLYACHRLERAVDGDSAPDAQVTVRIHVGRDGRVREAFIHRGDVSLDSDAAIRCVQDAVRLWRFPTRREESVIDYAFMLTAGATDSTRRQGVAPAVPTGAPAMPAGTPQAAVVNPADTATESPRAGGVALNAQVRIATGEAEVQGGIFGEDAHRVVRNRQGELRQCYERALRDSGDVSGRMTLALVIGPSGSVARATIQGSTVGNDAVERCIVDATRRWRFPPSRAGESASLRYPITLSTSAR
jgi:TonB family protein